MSEYSLVKVRLELSLKRGGGISQAKEKGDGKGKILGAITKLSKGRVMMILSAMDSFGCLVRSIGLFF